MIHIRGDGTGGVMVFDEPTTYTPAEPQPGLEAANVLDAAIGDDDLRPAGSNAAPPLTTEQAEG